MTNLSSRAADDPWVTLSVHDLLSFFDECPEGSPGHATAIVSMLGEDLGAGLLKHYFERTAGTTATVLPISPKPGTLKGSRLDRWMLVERPNSPEPPRLFQIEIKNWSAHAIGGQTLSVQCDNSIRENYGRRAWDGQWDNEKGNFRSEAVRKVLAPMRLPSSRDHIDSRVADVISTLDRTNIEPLACFWFPIHQDEPNEPLFSAALTTEVNGFRRVWIFSMSNYLRLLTEAQVRLYMPVFVQRWKWLNRLCSST